MAMDTGRRWQRGDDHNNGRMTWPYLRQSSKPCLNLTLLSRRKMIPSLPYQTQEDDGNVGTTWGRPQRWEDDAALPAKILEAMPQLDLALSPKNDTILALPPQTEADTLPGDVADAIQSLLPSRSAVPPNSSSMTRPS